MSSNKNELTVSGHVRELKRRLFLCVAAFIVLFIILYTKAPAFIRLFIKTGEQAGFTLGYLAPQEMLLQALRLSATVAVILSLPVILWQAGAFLMPAVGTAHGRKLIIIGLIASVFLFCSGITFCVEILFPFVFQYLHSYSEEFNVTGFISISSYLDLFLSTAWIMGFLFEIPLFAALLGAAGILRAEMMKKALKPAIVIIAIISAAITPPDVVSLVMVALPMIMIYVVSIGVCQLVSKKRKGGEKQ